MQVRITLESAKSYATEANLDAGLKRLGFHTHRHMVCRTPAGRWTAVFPASNFKDGGYVGLYSQHGFYTLG